MKKLLLSILCVFFASMYTTTSFAAIGDTFDADVNGVTMKFRVTADDEVEVYGPSSKISAIDRATEGNITVPATIANNAVTYNVTRIGDYAFFGCSTITSVAIQGNVESIGYRAFKYCYALEQINIPATVTAIAGEAFESDKELARVDITDIDRWCEIEFTSYVSNPTNYKKGLWLNGNQVTTDLVLTNATKINTYAFYRWDSFTGEIRIPSTVTEIKNNAITGFSSEAKVIAENIGAWCEIEFESASANPVNVTKKLFLSDGVTAPSTIPSGTTAIKNYAFYAARNITEMSIPATVTSIGTQAFFGCSAIENIYIDGNGLVGIGEQAFKNCTSLASIDFPGSITTVGGNAFENDKAITNIEISNLRAWCETDFANNYSSPINYCHTLTMGGERVEGDLVIPAGTTKIGAYTFYRYGGLTTITIPTSVQEIGAAAFSGNSEVTDVYCAGAPAVVTGDNPFGTLDADVVRSAVFHIDFDHMATYNAAEGWNSVKNYIAELDETALSDDYAYTNENSFVRQYQNIKVRYTRNFKNNNWQALFVPFNMKYEDLKANFDVAAILNNQTAGGAINVAKLSSGKLIAGKPYLIRAKVAGVKTIEASVSEFKAANDDSNPWVLGECTYHGVYTKTQGLKSIGGWAMASGKLSKPKSDEVTLSPFRWYMTEEAGLDVKATSLSFNIFEDGYQDAPDDEETAIEEVSVTTNKTEDNTWYTISGQRIAKPTQRGIYIKNGKKILF